MISDTLYEAAKDIRTYLELMPDVYRIYADRLNALVDAAGDGWFACAHRQRRYHGRRDIGVWRLCRD